jgi:hypothetical protein
VEKVPPLALLRATLAAGALCWAAGATGAGFAMPGGPEPVNLAETWDRLRQDPYDLELLISFGTSKGGSAGHLALAIREPGASDDTVYSANFYADRSEEHAKGFYTAELVTRAPKAEYLYGTRSSLGPDAVFGLDFGEVYKRSVVGVRVYGVAPAEKRSLAAYFDRINADYAARASNPEYHHGEVRYDYLRFNCAKTIGVAFRHGAGYRNLQVKQPRVFPGRTKPVAALQSNIPTEMAMKLMREWHARGYSMDAVLYRKYRGSAYSDPRDEPRLAFADLPDRFPSVLSLDFTQEAGNYEDYDNLRAMYLLYNLGKYGVAANGETTRLEIERAKEPTPYAEADKIARAHARSDSRHFLRRLPFIPKGLRIGDPVDNTRRYDFGGAQPPRAP